MSDDEDIEHIVKVNMHGISIDIACGDGKQTAKWLALVAAKRYTQRIHLLDKSHGRYRPQLDRYNKIVYQPFNVKYANEGHMVAPNALIKDIFPDGEGELDIELHKEVKVNDDGSPLKSVWTVAAFCHTDTVRDIYEAKLKEQEDTITAKDASDNAKNILEMYSDNAMTAELTASGNCSFLDTPEEIITDLEGNWENMKISELIETESELNEIKSVLLDHYRDLYTIFNYYSGSRGNTRLFNMSFIEFKHFVHQCTGLSVTNEMATIEAIFQASNIEKKASHFNPNNAFIFYEFLESIIRLSMETAAGLELKPADCVRLEIVNNIIPSLEMLLSGPVRSIRHSPDVTVVIEKNFTKIQKVYNKYCKTEASKPENLTSMLVEELVVLMSFTGFIDEEHVTSETVKIAFIDSQRTRTNINNISSESDLPEIIFVEFLDAISRVSLIAYEADETLTAKRKIIKGLNLIINFAKSI